MREFLCLCRSPARRPFPSAQTNRIPCKSKNLRLKWGMEEIDIWRTAAEMFRQVQAHAGVTAALRADALLDQGDTEGFAVWKRVVAAIEDLARKAPREGKQTN